MMATIEALRQVENKTFCLGACFSSALHAEIGMGTALSRLTILWMVFVSPAATHPLVDSDCTESHTDALASNFRTIPNPTHEQRKAGQAIFYKTHSRFRIPFFCPGVLFGHDNTSGRKMSRTWKITTFGAMLAVVVAGRAWIASHRLHLADAVLSHGTLPTSMMSPADPATTTGAAAAASKVAPVPPAPVVRQVERTKKQTTRALYVDPNLPLPARFAKLAQRAVDGDTTAKFYAQTLVADCKATSSLNSSAFYFGDASAYRTNLLASKKKVCAKLAEDKNYHEIRHFSDTHPNDALIQDVRQAIETAFANDGINAALETGVSAIAAQPDDVTVRLVADTFGTLGISGYIATTQLRSTASIPGATLAQQGLMSSALILLACDYGMPCGPESSAVSNLCIMMGQCIPGASVDKVLREREFSGQRWDDIMTLLAFLRQVPAHAPGQ